MSSIKIEDISTVIQLSAADDHHKSSVAPRQCVEQTTGSDERRNFCSTSIVGSMSE